MILAFLGPNELSVIERCQYYRDGVCKERLGCMRIRWVLLKGPGSLHVEPMARSDEYDNKQPKIDFVA